MLGIRGAAWLAGITFVIAALFLAKLGYDQGFFTPILRVTAMVLAGTGALVWAELGLRKGYRPGGRRDLRRRPRHALRRLVRRPRQLTA